MSNQSDTPETDSAEPKIKTTRGGWVRADFARKLERERDEARRQLAELQDQIVRKSDSRKPLRETSNNLD